MARDQVRSLPKPRGQSRLVGYGASGAGISVERAASTKIDKASTMLIQTPSNKSTTDNRLPHPASQIAPAPGLRLAPAPGPRLAPAPAPEHSKADSYLESEVSFPLILMPVCCNAFVARTSQSRAIYRVCGMFVFLRLDRSVRGDGQVQHLEIALQQVQNRVRILSRHDNAATILHNAVQPPPVRQHCTIWGCISF